MQVNPMQLIQMIKSGNNPQELMMSVLEQRASGNPMMENIMNLARNNQTGEIEKIARNVAAQRGLDFDKEFTAFKHKFGLR